MLYLREVDREEEADRRPRRRQGRHDDGDPAPRRFDADEAEICVVDRDDAHVYQPGLLFVPFGLAQVDEIVRPRRRQLRRGVAFHQNEVEEGLGRAERGSARRRKP